MKKTNKISIILILSLALNVGLILFGLNRYSQSSNFQSTLYPYIAKRVLVEHPNDVLLSFLDLRNKLTNQTNPWGNKFGLYFEYLPTGTSIGINSNEEFYAASLFKVPVIMAYYHYLEGAGVSKNQDLMLQKDDIDKDFGNLWRKGEGTKISSDDAIKLSLEESDNTAAKVIARQVDDANFQEVYQALDLDLHTGTGGAIMTARNYSTILKALYFSSVIDKEDSNRVLTYLTKSKFDDKLVAGVGIKVPIAHKIGDYRDANGSTAYQDCGIVYLDKRHYLLCMMSVGAEKAANERMKAISKIIYDYVSSAK